jgi:hypothetical protein
MPPEAVVLRNAILAFEAKGRLHGLGSRRIHGDGRHEKALPDERLLDRNRAEQIVSPPNLQWREEDRRGADGLLRGNARDATGLLRVDREGPSGGRQLPGPHTRRTRAPSAVARVSEEDRDPTAQPGQRRKYLAANAELRVAQRRAKRAARRAGHARVAQRKRREADGGTGRGLVLAQRRRAGEG